MSTWRFVFVHSKGCTHCTAFKPTWARIQVLAAEKALPIAFTEWKIGTVEREDLQRIRFKGKVPYLALILERNAAYPYVVPFVGKRSEESVLAFLQANTMESDMNEPLLD